MQQNSTLKIRELHKRFEKMHKDYKVGMGIDEMQTVFKEVKEGLKSLNETLQQELSNKVSVRNIQSIQEAKIAVNEWLKNVLEILKVEITGLMVIAILCSGCMRIIIEEKMKEVSSEETIQQAQEFQENILNFLQKRGSNS